LKTALRKTEFDFRAATSAPLDTSRSWVVPSAVAAATRLPFGLNWTATTPTPMPLSRAMFRAISASQMRMLSAAALWLSVLDCGGEPSMWHDIKQLCCNQRERVLYQFNDSGRKLKLAI